MITARSAPRRLMRSTRPLPVMRTCSALALGLVPAIVCLAVVSVTHVNGLSDPARTHSLGDHFVLTQVQAGFVAAGLAVFLLTILVLAWVAPGHRAYAWTRTFWSYTSRAPPSPIV